MVGMLHLHQHQWRGHSLPSSSLGCPLVVLLPCATRSRIPVHQASALFAQEPRVEACCQGYSSTLPWFGLHGISLPKFSARFSAAGAGDTVDCGIVIFLLAVLFYPECEAWFFGFSSAGDKRGATSHSTKLKVLQLLPLLLVGLGAFFAQQLPALADIGQHGAAASALRRPMVSDVIKSGWAGLMAGCLHTLTGPDHLAALAPLCIGRAKLESAVVGALWGCGHDAGQIIFGLFFLLLKGKLKIELLQVWASRVVGITLVAIGAVGLKEAQEVPVSVLATDSASPVDSSDLVEHKKSTNRLRTFATGIVYGLQPDALIMILPALALPSRVAGAAYLGMFLLGTVIAMGSYTAFIGSCGEALQKRLPRITQRLSVISSVVALLFGASVLLGELFGFNFFG